MSNHKFTKAIQTLSREIQRLYRSFNRALVNWLLRSAFVTQRRGQSATAGFVLPTVVLLLLVVTLTVGAMTLRAFDRNTQVIAESQQKVIYNAATPAIDRARSKLENLFDRTKDPRYPGGVPIENQLLGMMTNDGTTAFDGVVKVGKLTVPDADGKLVDPYTLPDEKRVDVGNPNGVGPDGNPANDNTWSYRADTNGDNQDDATVLYSILFKTPRPEGGDSAAALLFKQPDSWKAARGIVRGAPISNSSLTGCGSNTGGTGGLTTEAWFESGSSSSTIRKNFQVNAIVIPDSPKSAAVTLEFQQDRQIQRGNKWGAWFRYDLEVFPGPRFNWNGAMHTEGSLMLGGSSYNAYLVSSPASCLYQKESSVISVTQVKANPEKRIPDFIGQVAVGNVGANPSAADTAFIHIPPANNTGNPVIAPLQQTNDASKVAVGLAGAAQIGSDPVSLVLTENTQSANPTDKTNSALASWPTLKATNLTDRIDNKQEQIPYVDDLYRADDRYGPKPKYKDGEVGQEATWRIPLASRSGDPIPDGNPLITNDTDPSAVGLDGYWERRARAEGLRVLIGERLELGNIGGWVTPRDVNGDGYIDKPAVTGATPIAFNPRSAPTDTANKQEFDGDPLYPPTVKPYPFKAGTVVPHLTQQRRSLRDSLPAVQAAAVYHAAVGADKDYPVACLASTVHPGTIDTLRQSTNFMPTSFKSGATATNEYLLSDFFTGRGTDGWEFTPPGGDATTLATQLRTGQPLRIALDNLVNFAGDPDGAFPPKQDDTIHPYPALTMWGNFSNLRRALVNLDARGYDKISPADKTYIHTAACTIGMLAYEIDQVQKFDVTNAGNNSVWNASPNGRGLTDLSARLVLLIDGDVRNGEVLPKAQLSTYKYDPTSPDNLVATTTTSGPYNPRDYDNVPPEAYIAALKQQDIKNGSDYLNDPAIRLAEMIMLNHQIRRDRTFGFRPSPAFGEYALNFNSNVYYYPTACDPDLFALEDPSIRSTRYTAGTRIETPSTGGKLPLDATAADWQLTPIAPIANYTNEKLLPGAVADDLLSLSARRLALSRLCGGLRVPVGYDPKTNQQAALNATTGGFTPNTRPVVMPKFPALYYVFPEVAHSLRGEFVDANNTDAAIATAENVADRVNEWDHRQPGAISDKKANTVTTPAANRPPALAADAAVQAGLDPYDREPYVVDAYVNKIAGSYVFKPVNAAPPTIGRLKAYPTPLSLPTTTPALSTINPADLIKPGDPGSRQALGPGDSLLSRFPYAGSSPFPADDLAVADVAVRPRQINNFPANAPNAILPNYAPRETAIDASPNRIQVPKADPAGTAVTTLQPGSMPTTAWAVPFLDRAMYDGRQLQVSRIMDFDLAMLRSTKPAGQTPKNTEFAPNEPWLPMSGVVYAFREDAVREDAIARPVGGPIAAGTVATNPILVQGTAMDVTKPTTPYDPAQQTQGISIKSIDHLPDPERRVHGFRLRNAAQLKRNPSVIAGIEAAKNIRGLSFFTDQPVYMQGDFNLHQEGSGDENGSGALLEEFTQKIFPDGAADYSFAQFYTDRKTRDPNFSNLDKDRWRPAEVLADAISILSTSHCDGSIADAFVTPQFSNAIPNFGAQSNNIDRALYGSAVGQTAIGGLYQRGCSGSGPTSFSNQPRPTVAPPNDGQGWEWKREGAGMVGSGLSDFTTPIQIGRLGEPLLLPRPLKQTTPPSPTNLALTYLPTNYGLAGLQNIYADPKANAGRALMTAADTRMNAIVVSGLTPSRLNQPYGGLHNFPRFIENWGGRRFFFSGSFLQLNFSNYATSPFEPEGLEPGTVADAKENLPHYNPPNRLWGYDVALQFSPAGPAAARFVTQSPNRSEFYTEPPITDPYINRLCNAAKSLGATAPGAAKLNCPTQQ